MESITIDGIAVPKLGFGTWQITGGDCREAVRHALELGYRHIDTAQMYENEAEVGAGLAAAEVPREEVFLTTKVWMDSADRDGVLRTTADSLDRLGTDYVDLLLLHWPNPDVPIGETFAAMAELKDAGRIRRYGVSNFPPEQLREALEAGDPFCLQVEYHPYLDQSELLGLTREHGLLFTAYCPLARGRAVADPVLQAIAKDHGKSAAQVVLRWLLDQDGVAAIPKAASAEHRQANLEIFDFALSAAERERIAALAHGERLIDPGFAPNW